MSASEPGGVEPSQEAAPGGRWRSRLSGSAASSLAVTAATVVAAALGNFAAYKLIAMFATPENFTDYSTARRYVTFLLPIVVMGAGVSLPLRIAIRPVKPEALRLLYGQFATATVITAFAMLITLLAPAGLVETLAPGISKTVVLAVLAATLAGNFTGVLYAYYRGFQDFTEGAWVLVLATGVFPAVGAAFILWGTEWALWVWALLSVLLTAVFLVRLGRVVPGPVERLGPFIRSSLGRVPGDVAYGALFLIPVAQYVVVASSLDSAVFIYFFVLLGVLVAAASPIALILLPILGARVAHAGRVAARRLFVANLLLGLFVGLVAFAALRWGAGLIVRLLLAPQYLPAAGLLAQLAPAALGLSLFVFLRTAVDSLGEFPRVSLICLVAIGAYYVTRSVTPAVGGGAVVIATNVSLLVLGGLTTVVAIASFLRPGLTAPESADADSA